MSKTVCSLISQGTELAVLTGLAVSLRGRKPSYPIKAGYAAVDRVASEYVGVLFGWQ